MMMHPDNEITLIQSCTRMSLNFNGFKIVVLETLSLLPKYIYIVLLQIYFKVVYDVQNIVTELPGMFLLGSLHFFPPNNSV